MRSFGFSAPCAAAACSSFILLFLNVNALYNYGSGYDTPILVINLLFFLMWLGCAFVSRKAQLPWGGIALSLFLFLCITVVFCKNIFDGYFGMLDIATALRGWGRLHEDLLYNSSIAESIGNYLIPSTLIDGTSIRNSHYFSHILIALIYKITGIPPFFIYNYLYPQVFISLFLYLYFRLIISIGKKFSCPLNISLLTGALLLLAQILLVGQGLSITSQTFFISITLYLLYFNVAEKYDFFSAIANSRKIKVIAACTSLFIFIISLSKISTGFIFCAGCSWFCIRQKTCLFKRIVILFFFLLSFLLALALCKDASVVVSGLAWHSNNYYMIIRCIKHFVAVLLVILIRFSKFFSTNSLHELIEKRKTTLEECALVCLLICSFLPFILVIVNDYNYFMSAFSFFGLLALYYTLAEFYLPEVRLSISKNRLHVLIWGILLCAMLVHPTILACKSLANVFSNLKYQRSIQAGTENLSGNLSFKKYFSENRFFKSPAYAMLRAMRTISDGHKDEYGLYVAANDALHFRFPLAEAFYYQALTGIVRYGALMKTKKGLFSSTGKLVHKNPAYPYLGFHKLTIPAAASLDLAMQKAAADGRKYLFFIDNDQLFLINIKTGISEPVPLPKE